MDIISVLPDAIANQIAAGEVVQRPMSVVKELMENALDAGATNVVVHVWDAGKTEIKVLDNGMGMSPTDARLAIERHATSKIKESQDLFQIATMGFRGEALASIASISHLEIKTKRAADELGTELKVEGSHVISQEPVATETGSSFSVKNLFYNVPARRSFLKSNNAENKHIMTVYNRIVLCYPEISFKLFSNGKLLSNLPASKLKQRLLNTMGSSLNSNLIEVHTHTSMVNINGYVGKPEIAKKTHGEQYFFVNGRYMRHPFFHRAILNAFERVLRPGTVPSYYLYLETDPSNIDVNVHPTKTEIKFKDEQSIFQIIQASVKESIGKYNLQDVLDFENPAPIDLPIIEPQRAPVAAPELAIDENFNPFTAQPSTADSGKERRQQISNFVSQGNRHTGKPSTQINKNWQDLYAGFEQQITNSESSSKEETKLFPEDAGQAVQTKFFQLKNRYILTSAKSGLLMIDQKRAQERILFDKFCQSTELQQAGSKKVLFPIELEFSQEECTVLEKHTEIFKSLGFEYGELKDNKLSLTAIPSMLQESQLQSVLSETLHKIECQEDASQVGVQLVAEGLAKNAALNFVTPLDETAMQQIFNQLFSCANANYTPSGKLIVKIYNMEELLKGWG